jgi:hypothetical protein
LPDSDTPEQDLLIEAYRDFNARRMDAVLARMHPAVEWANGMEGGHVHGVEEVRAYWTRQWSMIDPRVEPLRVERDQAGRYVVEVHQVVRDLEGNLLQDAVVHHAYLISGGLIERMDIQKKLGF